jgi:hypothetical protein
MYGAAWNPTTNKGRVLITINNARQSQEVPIDNADEFLVMLLMLSKTGVQFDTQTKEIEFPFRPVGT